jgi:tetratricopeptide (TPR) repeat protein
LISLNTVNAHLEKAWYEWSHGNITEAATIWFSIKELLENSKHEILEIDVNNYLAMYQRVWEGKDDSIIDIEINLKQAQKLNYLKGIVYSKIELAFRTPSVEEAQNNFREARSIALTIFEKEKRKSELIRVTYLYGVYLVKRGIEKFGYLFEQFQTALQYAIEENNKYFIAEIHHGIGEAFLRLGNLKEAQHHFEISLQIHKYLNNDRKILGLLVSIADVEMQTEEYDSLYVLEKNYKEFNNLISEVREKIPLTDLFNHLSRFSDIFLEQDAYKQVSSLVNELEKILRQANINSRLFFEGKMALASIKGNMELKKLNLNKAEELNLYITKRREQARISDLYNALISLAIISIYKYRIFFDMEHLTRAHELIKDAIKISKDTDHIRGYVRASMVEVMLKITTGGKNADLSEMERVINIAQEKGLHIEARHAQKELLRFRRVNIGINHTSLDNRSVAEVLQYAIEAKKIVRKIQ